MNLFISKYIFKTIISFISLNAILIMFNSNFQKIKGIKHNRFLKRNFNRLLPCLIPVFRWVWLILLIIIAFALSSNDLTNKINEKNEVDKQ